MTDTHISAAIELEQLVAKAAELHWVLEDAREKQEAAQAIIDATINDFVATENRISRLTDAMIYKAAAALPDVSDAE